MDILPVIKSTGEVLTFGGGNAYGNGRAADDLPVRSDVPVRVRFLADDRLTRVTLLPASGALTLASQPVAGDGFTVGSVTYTAVSALTGAANQVLLGANSAAFAANLAGAMRTDTANGQAAGTTYGYGTAVNPAASASVFVGSSVQVIVIARYADASGNAVVTTTTSTHASFGAATLTGGEVLKIDIKPQGEYDADFIIPTPSFSAPLDPATDDYRATLNTNYDAAIALLDPNNTDGSHPDAKEPKATPLMGQLSWGPVGARPARSDEWQINLTNVVRHDDEGMPPLAAPPAITREEVAAAVNAVSTGATVYVDSVNGNNATAARATRSAYATLGAARTAAQAGDVIWVRPGAYTVADSLLKNGVNWHFTPGASVTRTTSGGGIFDDGGAAVDSQVSGSGQFELIRPNNNGENVGVVKTTNRASRLTVSADSIVGTGHNVTGLDMLGGDCTVRARLIQGGRGAGMAVAWTAGNCHVYAAIIRSGYWAVWSGEVLDVTAVDGNGTPTAWASSGDCWVVADTIELIDNGYNFPDAAIITTPNDADSDNLNYGALWVTAQTIRDVSTTRAQAVAVSNRGAKLYIQAEKITGKIENLSGLTYLNSQKASLVTSRTPASPVLLDCEGGTMRANVLQWEDGSATVAGGAHEIAGTFASTRGVTVTGGVVRLQDCTIDTTGGASTNPLTVSGGSVTLKNAQLLAATGRDSIYATSAQTVRASGLSANTPTNSNVTIDTSQSLPAAATFDLYVDSISGNDHYSGKTSDAPLRSLAALLPAAALRGSGVKIGLARGSYWRESLDLSGIANATVAAVGSGAAPVIDGADVVAAWTKTTGRVDVYQATVTHDATDTNRLTVYEDGALLTRVADQATCDAVSASFVDVKGSDGSPVTVYIHPTDSEDPNTNNHLVEVTTRLHVIYGAGDLSVTGIEARRAISNNGALDATAGSVGAGVVFSRLLTLHGTKHNAVIGAGTVRDSLALFSEPGTSYEPGSVGWTGYQPDPTGQSLLFERCGTVGLRSADYLGHGNGAQVFASSILRQCWTLDTSYPNIPEGSGTRLAEGCYCRGTAQPPNAGTWSQCMIYLPATAGYTDTGYLYGMAWQHSVCYAEARYGLGIYNALFNATSNVSFDHGAFAGLDSYDYYFSYEGFSSGTMSSHHSVYFGGSRSMLVPVGVTYSGDYNVLWSSKPDAPEAYLRWHGTDYTTLASWQAATGQDAHSVYLKAADQTAGGVNAFWLAVANAATGTSLATVGPRAGDWRVNPAARVYGADGTAYVGTFPDGTAITTAGPQTHWGWNARASAAGAPTGWPSAPATLADARAYVLHPEAWVF